MKKAVNISIILLLIIGLYTVVYGQEPVITNEEAVVNSVEKAIYGKLSAYGKSSLYINSADKGINQPISQGIINAAKKGGMRVYLDETKAADYQVLYDVLGFEFKYENGSSRGFLRDKKIRRNLNTLLRLTLKTTDDGEVAMLDDLRVVFEDEIDPGYFDYVSSDDIPSLSPLPPKSTVKKIAEPVVMTTAIGALVFLFFANR